MLKQFNETFFDALVNKRGSLVLGVDKQNEICKNAKNVRSVDYVVKIEVNNGVANPLSIVTRANWHFILTNAAVYWDPSNDVADYPRVGLNFPDYTPQSPFGTLPADVYTVPTNLVFGREGAGRFEEYKNLYYSLGQRFVIEVHTKATKPNDYRRGYLMLTGLEVNLKGDC